MKTREVNGNDTILPSDEMIVVRNTAHAVTIRVDPATLPILQFFVIENCSIGPVLVYPGRHFIHPGYRVRIHTSDRRTLKTFGLRARD